MTPHDEPLTPPDIEAMALKESLAESFLPKEDVAAMERAGEYYEDAKRGAEYVLEGGDARSAIGDLNWAHAGYGIDRDDLKDHPAAVIAKQLSDEMNASRISNRREPPAPRELRY